MTDNGTYIVFEGGDFCGKTLLSTLVQKKLQETAGDRSILTRHPGATKLGQHLRQLVKTPEAFGSEIVIDPLSAQTLMMVDQICFINTILKPRLTNGDIILADRSNFISCIAYGLPEGLDISSLNKLLQLGQSPRPDKVYILDAPWDVIQQRMRSRGRVSDRFEDNGDTYLQKVNEIYKSLTQKPELLVLVSNFVPIDRITYIDSTKEPELLAKEIAQEILDIDDDKKLALSEAQ